MGAFSGPITASAYRVQGTPKDWNQVFEEMARSRFQDLLPGTEKDRSMGWVLSDDPFSTDFSRATLFRGEILVLTLRMDVLSLPGGQLKLHVEKAVAERLKKEGRDRLNRKEQEELADEVRFNLLNRMVPNIKLAELVWATDSGRAWFFSRAAALVQPFEELFTETFGVRLVSDAPYTVAAASLGEERADQLMDWNTALLVEPEL
ncbi:MAG: recombination-associated protein RdgC [Pseudomonadota bacterium]